MRQNGVSKRDLAETVEGILLGEGMAKYSGPDKAIAIRSELRCPIRAFTTWNRAGNLVDIRLTPGRKNARWEVLTVKRHGRTFKATACNFLASKSSISYNVRLQGKGA